MKSILIILAGLSAFWLLAYAFERLLPYTL